MLIENKKEIDKGWPEVLAGTLVPFVGNNQVANMTFGDQIKFLCKFMAFNKALTILWIIIYKQETKSEGVGGMILKLNHNMVQYNCQGITTFSKPCCDYYMYIYNMIH